MHSSIELHTNHVKVLVCAYACVRVCVYVCFDSVHESVNQLECTCKLAHMCFSVRLLRNLVLLDSLLLHSVCHSTCFLCYTILALSSNVCNGKQLIRPNDVVR